jgi:hypothetical protein
VLSARKVADDDKHRDSDRDRGDDGTRTKREAVNRDSIIVEQKLKD